MSLLNLDYVNEITGGDAEMLNELLVTFQEQVEEMKNTLPSLLELDTPEDIKQMAHKFKSSMRVFGIEELAGRLEKLEHNAFDLSKEALKNSVDEIIEQSKALLLEIAEVLKQQ